jgi:hypothetical protein
MYRKKQQGETYEPHSIEEICYEPDHIDRVTSEIKSTFPDYFQK